VFVGASAMVFDGVTDPVLLESYACREALNLAADLHQQKVMIASDCLTVVKEINGQMYNGKNGMILRDISQYRSSFQESVFGHERLEANGGAHRLAKMSTSLDIGRHVWLIDPPDHLYIPINIMQ
jgi:ribonuclease HI